MAGHGIQSTELSVPDYVEARAQEIMAMAGAARKIMGNNQPLQKLPRHMRRRAASHNIKRLPRTMKNWAQREYAKAGPPHKNKRPSRKHRRRPKNLTEEYARRKRNHIWLETHIWHAKRFHMTEKWGYKIPLHPNDKGARAAYRATAKYCLLQDFSYYCCVELNGSENEIIRALSHLSSPDTGLTIGAKTYTKGTREGHIVLYHHDQYPYGALGPAKFLWRYIGDHSSEVKRVLWVWVHPAMYQDFMMQLRKSLGLDAVDEMGDAKMEDKANKDEKVKTYTAERFSSGNVKVTSLKDTLCRFHLIGPLSSDVLLETLKLSGIETEDSTAMDCEETTPWWKQYYRDSVHREQHQKQQVFWKELSLTESPGELPPHCVIGLTVRDPRKLLPHKKSMVKYEHTESCISTSIPEIPNNLSCSAIWNSAIRTDVKSNMLTTAEINAKRSKMMVPGSQLSLTEDESRIPVLLIQNPGHRVTTGKDAARSAPCWLGYGAGWDIIIPSGWATPFLISMVFRGARVGGLKETQSLALDAGVHIYPNNYPDSSAGKDWEAKKWADAKKKDERTPAGKRPNFEKMKIVAPFHCPWEGLVKEWSTCSVEEMGGCTEVGGYGLSDRWYVLRSRIILQQIQKLLSMKEGKSLETPSSSPKAKIRRAETMSSVHDNIKLDLIPVHPAGPHCLLSIRISMINHGQPQPNSIICLPSQDDMEQIKLNNSAAGPIEEIKKVKLTKADKKAKSKKKSLSTTKEELPKLADVANSCSRPIIGYLHQGAFSYAGGCGFGLGFMAYSVIQELLERKYDKLGGCVVLVRTPTSLQYRYAIVTICC